MPSGLSAVPEHGLGRLPDGKRRRNVEQRWRMLVDAFSDTIAVYDVAAARATAGLLVDAEIGGHPMALADGQIVRWRHHGATQASRI